MYVRAFFFFFFLAEQDTIRFTFTGLNKTLLQNCSFDIHIIKEVYPYYFLR